MNLDLLLSYMEKLFNFKKILMNLAILFINAKLIANNLYALQIDYKLPRI